MLFTRTQEKTWRARIMVVLAMSVITLPLWSQRSRGGLANGDHYHFGYVSGHVGYSILSSRAAGVMPAGNIGGGFGVGYEYRNSGLWANLGVQLSFHRSSLVIDEYNTRNETDQRPYKGFDTQGRSTTFHYRVHQTDNIEWNFLDIPVLFGYYTHGFHVGAGVKLSYAISSRTRAAGTYNLSATNDDLAVTFENKPEAGYTDYPFENSDNNRLNIGASVIGEIGYDLLSSAPFSSSTCHVLKLSFYIEYGLNNLAKGNDFTVRSVVPNPNNAREATINPYLNTVSAPARTVPFFAGVKLTYMIGGSRTARRGFHHGCMCYN